MPPCRAAAKTPHTLVVALLIPKMTGGVLLLSCTLEFRGAEGWVSGEEVGCRGDVHSQEVPALPSRGPLRHSCYLESWKEVDQCQKEDGAVGFNLTCFANVTLEHKGREEKCSFMPEFIFVTLSERNCSPGGIVAAQNYPKH